MYAQTTCFSPTILLYILHLFSIAYKYIYELKGKVVHKLGTFETNRKLVYNAFENLFYTCMMRQKRKMLMRPFT